MTDTPPKRSLLGLSGALAAALALGACHSSARQAAESPSAPAGQPGGQQGDDPARVVDQKLGASYVIPKGYRRASASSVVTSGSEEPVQPLEVDFVLDGSYTGGVGMSLWRLSKDSSQNAQFAAMDVNQSVEHLANLAPTDKHGVIVHRTNWGSPRFPAAAIAVISPLEDPEGTPSATPGDGSKRSLTYSAFLSKDDQKWMVLTSALDFPHGLTREAVVSASEALARSVRPLP